LDQKDHIFTKLFGTLMDKVHKRCDWLMIFQAGNETNSSLMLL